MKDKQVVQKKYVTNKVFTKKKNKGVSENFLGASRKEKRHSPTRNAATHFFQEEEKSMYTSTANLSIQESLVSTLTHRKGNPDTQMQCKEESQVEADRLQLGHG
jgi:hypothetical protein